MKYILLSSENQVREIIPAEDPALPGISINQRYSVDFIAQLLPTDDAVEVETNWIYDPETGAFSEPVVVDGDDPELTDAEALAIIVGGAVNA